MIIICLVFIVLTFNKEVSQHGFKIIKKRMKHTANHWNKHKPLSWYNKKGRCWLKYKNAVIYSL